MQGHAGSETQWDSALVLDGAVAFQKHSEERKRFLQLARLDSWALSSRKVSSGEELRASTAARSIHCQQMSAFPATHGHAREILDQRQEASPHTAEPFVFLYD